MRDDLLDRMLQAVERVEGRLRRACSALDSAQIPYAIIGGYAAAAWIATVDESAARNSPKIELLLRRVDFRAAAVALKSAGFIRQGESVFLDGPDAKNRDSVQIIFAGERRWEMCEFSTPDVADARLLRVAGADLSVIELEPFVRMNLDAFKLDDRVDLDDLIDVGLLNADWCGRFDPRLATRLRKLLDEAERQRRIL